MGVRERTAIVLIVQFTIRKYVSDFILLFVVRMLPCCYKFDEEIANFMWSRTRKMWTLQCK